MMRRSQSLLVACIMFCASCVGSSLPANPNLEAILSSYEKDQYADLHSVIVIKDGDLIAERYFNGGDHETLVDVRSAGKSVTSLLLGIVLDQGKIDSLDDPVAKYWPNAEGSAIGSVRLTDVLTMRTGLDADGENPGSLGYEDNMDSSDDTLSFALSIPKVEEPGTKYRYNSLAAFVSGVVIGQAADSNMEEFARVNLFEPLGFSQWEWQEDASGVTKGQGNLFLTAPDFANIGEMVLNGGTYDGQQVVSSKWIEDSLEPRVDISDSDPFASAGSIDRCNTFR